MEFNNFYFMNTFIGFNAFYELKLYIILTHGGHYIRKQENFEFLVFTQTSMYFFPMTTQRKFLSYIISL